MYNRASGTNLHRAAAAAEISMCRVRGRSSPIYIHTERERISMEPAAPTHGVHSLIGVSERGWRLARNTQRLYRSPRDCSNGGCCQGGVRSFAAAPHRAYIIYTHALTYIVDADFFLLYYACLVCFRECSAVITGEKVAVSV